MAAHGGIICHVSWFVNSQHGKGVLVMCVGCLRLPSTTCMKRCIMDTCSCTMRSQDACRADGPTHNAFTVTTHGHAATLTALMRESWPLNLRMIPPDPTSHRNTWADSSRRVQQQQARQISRSRCHNSMVRSLSRRVLDGPTSPLGPYFPDCRHTGAAGLCCQTCSQTETTFAFCILPPSQARAVYNLTATWLK